MKRMTKPKVSVSEAPPERSSAAEVNGNSKKLRVLVAESGIGGLVFALAGKRKGFDVMVFEKDLSTIRGERQYRGPIQIQSNALAALEAIDLEVADEVMKTGCITGDQINGLVDGISGNWYCKFDTFTPAAERGLPVTRVISRMTLQQILDGAVGEDVIMNDSNVVNLRMMVISVAVMTRTYPEDSGERKELILLQNIASYMLLACGAIYLISIEEDSH